MSAFFHKEKLLGVGVFLGVKAQMLLKGVKS